MLRGGCNASCCADEWLVESEESAIDGVDGANEDRVGEVKVDGINTWDMAGTGVEAVEPEESIAEWGDSCDDGREDDGTERAVDCR
jgi:hypothetical protein